MVYPCDCETDVGMGILFTLELTVSGSVHNKLTFFWLRFHLRVVHSFLFILSCTIYCGE